MTHDFELPGGFQDADFEMRELTASANQAAHLRRKGICVHNWFGPVEIGKRKYKCHDCGKVFDSEEDLHAEHRELLI